MPTDLPNVARVAVEGTYDSERFVNVLHFYTRDGSPWSAADLTLLLGELDDPAVSDASILHLYQFMDAGVLIDTLTATSLDTTTPVQVSASVSLAGTSVGTNMPPMLAVVTKWGTAVANRKYRGRSFLTGCNSNHVSGTNADRVDTTVLGTIATAAAEFVLEWQANLDRGFCILSQTDRIANVAVPFQEVISASANPLLCVQRRRRERP